MAKSRASTSFRTDAAPKTVTEAQLEVGLWTESDTKEVVGLEEYHWLKTIRGIPPPCSSLRFEEDPSRVCSYTSIIGYFAESFGCTPGYCTDR